MDITTAAANLLTYLTPCLAYLIKAGENATGGAAKKFGENAWNWARAVWDKLRPKVEGQPAASEAVRGMVDAPDDVDAQAALRLQLKKLFVQDEALAGEVARLWEAARQVGLTVISIGGRSVAPGGNISRSIVITRDRNVVQSGRIGEAGKE